MSAIARKPILIAGAGVSSLLLAQALRRASIPFRIYERDASITFRAQGYRLRLSNEGLDAIEAVLGPEGFQKFWDVCGKTGGVGFSSIHAITGQPFNDPLTAGQSINKKPEPTGESKGPTETLASRGGKVVGIARGEMRKQFIDGLEPYIHWSSQVTGYESTSVGVGGEGLYSRVADQVSEGKLKVYDTGARGIHGQAPTTAFNGLGEGVWRIVDDSKPDGRVFIITNVRSGDMDDPSIEFGWTMGAQPGVINPPNDDYTITGTVAADIAKEITKNWAPNLQPLFAQMNTSEAAFWKITCSTPTGVPEWKNDSRVTVIGDAAHSMTPAGGIGANTAVQDSALLGRLLAEAGGWRDGVTAEYEKGMRVYASNAHAYPQKGPKIRVGHEVNNAEGLRLLESEPSADPEEGAA
ncbi:hypothetical protein NPX13_g3608 [Xylaria arbuscula]|uniref:FAD-binding domain-containing protein n=1 Tax=Xylaria arbuscula TaxID=114810 RepID=A0A9W8NI45_9PEZI|nr:hypothetical protein NPX13_g3608 [Xylaria arbuscula]